MEHEGEQAPSLRAAYYREAKLREQDYIILLAESAAPLTTEAGYDDLLRFESDIAQVVGLILLFAESAGSLAELGSFAVMPTVSPSLLAVLDDYYYNRSSFIRNGPVQYLENEHDEQWVTVLERAAVGIGGDGQLDHVNQVALYDAIEPAIQDRMAMQSKWRKFDPKNDGHLILCIVGFCQEFGALTQSEMRRILKKIGVEEFRIKNFLYCGELLGWLKRIRKGHHIYYASTGGEYAIDFSFKDEFKPKDKVRWRAMIRDHWQEKEPARMRAISESLAEGLDE
jgi:hypothetical protein